MAYVLPNFKTKKQLKDAVARGDRVTVVANSPFGVKQDGNVTVEGPHSPQPHTWYATVEVKGGLVMKVK